MKAQLRNANLLLLMDPILQLEVRIKKHLIEYSCEDKMEEWDYFKNKTYETQFYIKLN